MLFVRSPRMPARRHTRALFCAEALLLLVVAIPSLLPYATTFTDLISLPLRVPTLSLGVALAAVDPLIVEQWRRNRNHDYSTVVAACIGFGLTLVVAAVLLLNFDKPDCTGHGLGCTVMAHMAAIMGCELLLACLITALLGGLLGYTLGAWIARSDRWT